MEDSTVAVNDSRFACGTNKIGFGNQSKTLYTKEKGLSGVYFGWVGNVSSSNDDLQDSNDDGRVVVFNAEGVASENSELEAIEQKYQTNLKELKNRIDAKLAQ